MNITKLDLSNFRNFQQLKLKFSKNGNIICGRNGIGKTNILESIYYLAFGKSFRTGHDDELINFAKDFFRISAEINISNKTMKISAAADANIKRFTVDELNISRISELYNFLKVVYFSPDDIDIINGFPLKRRKFFDQAISQYSFQYIHLFNRFKSILKQRNALLKQKFEKAEKEIWDRQFIEFCCKIITIRQEYLKIFTPLLQEKYKTVGSGKESASIHYKYSFPCPANDDYKSAFTNYLKINEEKEIFRQRSSAGPQLDEYEFIIDGRNARDYASQGQKRTLIIAARLAQVEIIRSALQDYPIIIFDDVLADLDKQRTERVFQLLNNDHQVLIATPKISEISTITLPVIDLEKYENK